MKKIMHDLKNDIIISQKKEISSHAIKLNRSFSQILIYEKIVWPVVAILIKSDFLD